MLLIIGLGNTSEDYKMTRHNFGQMVVESLAQKKALRWRTEKELQTLLTDFKLGNKKVFLAIPLTFMNESGQAVQKLKRYFKLPTNKIVIVHDELDIPFKKIRLSQGRGAGGHNGVQSIIDQLKSKDFKRIRLGIGPKTEPADRYVLKKFSAEEKKHLPEIMDTCHLIIEYMLENNFAQARNKYNEKDPEN